MNKKKWLRVALLLFILVLFGIVYYFSIINTTENLEYYTEFFDDTIHKVDIRISESDWNDIINNPLEEEYHSCNIVIDGKKLKNVGIRTKGNTSLELVSESGVSDRYSFKINFGKYNKEQTFYGLDEICFNNIFADATYLKEYFSYDMFKYIGVVSPLCTFVDISINGKPWGLYLAVESIDDSFLIRNFGENYGELYKPENELLRYEAQNGIPEGTDIKIMGEDLIYINDDFDSYYTIFDTAKTDIADVDKVRLISSIKLLNESEDLSDVIDIEKTLKFWVVNNFISNYDSYIGPTLHNYYLYEKNGVLMMLPWDYNLSFGGYRQYMKDINEEVDGINEATETINLSILNPIRDDLIGQRPFFEKVVATNETEYIDYIDKFILEYFESGYFENKYFEITKEILPYIESDMTSFYTLEEVKEAQNLLKDFIDLRVKSVRGQLDGSVIYKDISTYIDASHIDILKLGHQRGGYFHIKG